MNFKKPKMENLTGALVTGGSAVAGAAASNLLVAELTAKSSGDAKKDSNRKKLVKGGAVVASLLALACVDGNDTGANAVRGALIGVAGAQGISLAREFTAVEKTGETMKKALGLGCPCQEDGLRQPDWSSWRPTYEDISYTEVSDEKEEIPSRNPLIGFTPKESYL